MSAERRNISKTVWCPDKSKKTSLETCKVCKNFVKVHDGAVICKYGD